jgi:hypothetical protein
MLRNALTLTWLLLAAAANGAVTEPEVNYTSGSVVLRGSLSYDDALPGRRPALLVVHEWSGLNEHARHSARRNRTTDTRIFSRYRWF